MSGRQSAATQHAIQLVAQGNSLKDSAAKAGIWYSTLWRALHPQKKKTKKSRKDSA
jgi:hypothetical protein